MEVLIIGKLTRQDKCKFYLTLIGIYKHFQLKFTQTIYLKVINTYLLFIYIFNLQPENIIPAVYFINYLFIIDNKN